MTQLAANALTTDVRAKETLGIEGDEARRLINAASDFIAHYTGRKYGKQTSIVEAQPGHGLDKMVLDRTPILSLISITYAGATVDLSDVVIIDADAGIIQRAGGFFWTAHVQGDMSRTALPGTERPLYVVTYDAGYVLPKDDSLSTPRTLPEDLENAALEMTRFFSNSLTRDPNIKSEKLMSWSATYRDDVDVPPTVKMILDSYRSIAL